MARVVDVRRWATEFDGKDGARYIGPLLLADDYPMAAALLSCVRGPDGQPIVIIGELIAQQPVADEGMQSLIRRVQ